MGEKRKKTPIVKYMKRKKKPYRLSGITEKEDIKCQRPFSLSWKKKTVLPQKKNFTDCG